MNKLVSKKCQRCGTSIPCNVEDIKNCFCSKIELSEKTRASISQNFTDCLCEACLKALSRNESKIRESSF